eukprot:gene2942-24879_t
MFPGTYYGVNNTGLRVDNSGIELSLAEGVAPGEVTFDCMGTSGGMEFSSGSYSVNGLAWKNCDLAFRLSSVYIKFSRCIFQGNTALQKNASVVVLNSGTVEFSQCTFANNAAGGGGAIDIQQGHAFINSCTFDSNAGVNGGGSVVAVSSATAEINASSFVGNTEPLLWCRGSGGAITVHDSGTFGGTGRAACQDKLCHIVSTTTGESLCTGKAKPQQRTSSSSKVVASMLVALVPQLAAGGGGGGGGGGGSGQPATAFFYINNVHPS